MASAGPSQLPRVPVVKASAPSKAKVVVMPKTMPIDVRFCVVCQRGPPVAVYHTLPDNSPDPTQDTCVECLGTVAYPKFWLRMRGKMARRIQKAAQKEPERQARYQAMLQMYEGKARDAETKHKQNPTHDSWALVMRYRQLAAGKGADLGAPPVAIDAPGKVDPPKPPAPPPIPIGPLAAPAGSLVVSEMVYNLPEMIYEDPRRHYVLSHAPQPSVGLLAPTILRSISEPHRSCIWLKTNYAYSQTEKIAQNAVFAAYVQAVAPSIPLQYYTANNVPGQPIDPSLPLGKPTKYFPPDALKGHDLISSIPKLFTSVTLNKVGFVCVSFRRKTPKERQELWAMIEPALRKSGPEAVVTALTRTSDGPGLQLLAHTKIPGPGPNRVLEVVVPPRTQLAMQAVPPMAVPDSAASSRPPGLPTAPLPAQAPQPMSANNPGNMLPQFRHTRLLDMEKSQIPSSAISGQNVYHVPGHATTTPLRSAPIPIARPIAEPQVPFPGATSTLTNPIASPITPHPMFPNRVPTPNSASSTRPAKRKVLHLSRPNSPAFGGAKPIVRPTLPGGDDPFDLVPPGGDGVADGPLVVREVVYADAGPSGMGGSNGERPAKKMKHMGKDVMDAIVVD